MANCKDCVHYDVCDEWSISVNNIGIIEDGFEVCQSFKDKSCIRNAHTADVHEVRHGKWKKQGSEKTCSVCRFIYYGNSDDWNYCPNCGARMYGKENTNG